MERQEATSRISQILLEIEHLLEEATELADEHDISFTYQPPGSASVKYKPAVIWEASTSCEWETSDEVDPGYWEEKWQSSDC